MKITSEVCTERRVVRLYAFLWAECICLMFCLHRASMANDITCVITERNARKEWCLHAHHARQRAVLLFVIELTVIKCAIHTDWGNPSYLYGLTRSRELIYKQQAAGNMNFFSMLKHWAWQNHFGVLFHSIKLLDLHMTARYNVCVWATHKTRYESAKHNYFVFSAALQWESQAVIHWFVNDRRYAS